MAAARRALLSVSDKTDLVPFAQELKALGFDLVSTGGTHAALQAAGVPVKDVSGITGFPEILDGRVKTLHPAVHAGILARRNEPGDLEVLAEHGIGLFDLVVVNLYPFKETVDQPGYTHAEAIKNIDVGGHTLVRAAAKNYQFVYAVTSPRQYDEVLATLRRQRNGIDQDFAKGLAAAAFALTAEYDNAVAWYLLR